MTDPNDIKGYTIGFYDPKVNDGKKQALVKTLPERELSILPA